MMTKLNKNKKTLQLWSFHDLCYLEAGRKTEEVNFCTQYVHDLCIFLSLAPEQNIYCATEVDKHNASKKAENSWGTRHYS